MKLPSVEKLTKKKKIQLNKFLVKIENDNNFMNI